MESFSLSVQNGVFLTQIQIHQTDGTLENEMVNVLRSRLQTRTRNILGGFVSFHMIEYLRRKKNMLIVLMFHLP